MKYVYQKAHKKVFQIINHKRDENEKCIFFMKMRDENENNSEIPSHTTETDKYLKNMN